MSRAELYFLDPHTWISTLPEQARERLQAHGERGVSDALTRLGPDTWRKALADHAVSLPRLPASPGSLARALEDPLTDLQILTLAVFWTRYRLCVYMRSSTGVFHRRVEGRNPLLDLDNAGIEAARLVFSPPGWAVPFGPNGRFRWSVWHSDGCGYP